MATKNIFYWGTGSFSGSGQFNEGPFHVGAINTLIRVKVSGAQNFQAVSLSATGVYANLMLWAISWVLHGDSPLDVILAGDTDQFLVREQTKEDLAAAWAPTSGPGVFLASNEVTADWSGQLAFGGTDIDLYLSFAPPFGGSMPNFNTYGTVETWYG